jgi:hypothetical protein
VVSSGLDFLARLRTSCELRAHEVRARFDARPRGAAPGGPRSRLGFVGPLDQGPLDQRPIDHVVLAVLKSNIARTFVHEVIKEGSFVKRSER